MNKKETKAEMARLLFSSHDKIRHPLGIGRRTIPDAWRWWSSDGRHGSNAMGRAQGSNAWRGCDVLKTSWPLWHSRQATVAGCRQKGKKNYTHGRGRQVT